MTAEVEPTLKCIIAWSDGRNLCDLIGQEIAVRVGEGDFIRVNEDTHLAYTHEDTASIRDWITHLLREGESVLVLEYERWSGWGPGVDRDWLNARGH